MADADTPSAGSRALVHELAAAENLIPDLCHAYLCQRSEGVDYNIGNSQRHGDLRFSMA